MRHRTCGRLVVAAVALSGVVANAGAEYYSFTFSAPGMVSVNSLPESTLGTITLTAFGETGNAIFSNPLSQPYGASANWTLDAVRIDAPGVSGWLANPGTLHLAYSSQVMHTLSFGGTGLPSFFGPPGPDWILAPVPVSGTTSVYHADAPIGTLATGDTFTYRYSGESFASFAAAPAGLPGTSAPVPEPSAFILSLLGLAAFGALRRKQAAH
jgi:hypothetical protein